MENWIESCDVFFILKICSNSLRSEWGESGCERWEHKNEKNIFIQTQTTVKQRKFFVRNVRCCYHNKRDPIQTDSMYFINVFCFILFPVHNKYFLSIGNAYTTLVNNLKPFVFSKDYYFPYLFYIHSPSIKKGVKQIESYLENNTVKAKKLGRRVYGLPGSNRLNELQNISSEYWGYLACFPTSSPKNQKSSPWKGFLYFSENFFFLLWNDCWPSRKIKKNSCTLGWLLIKCRIKKFLITQDYC